MLKLVSILKFQIITWLWQITTQCTHRTTIF